MKARTAEKVIGYILLTPALFSVVLFFYDLLLDGLIYDLDFFSNRLDMIENLGLSRLWTGDYFQITRGPRKIEGAGGYTSALPFYFGLMALAGAYLIKDKTK